jgi:hypothetical protein
MYARFLAAASLALAATGAHAELNYVNVFAKHQKLDDGGLNPDLTVFGGAFEYGAGAWTLSGDIGTFDILGATQTNLSFGAEYKFETGFGLGIDHVKLDGGGLVSDLAVTSLYGYYDFGTYALGASIGDSSDLTDPLVTIFGAWDVTPTGRIGVEIMELDGEAHYASYADYTVGNYDLGATFMRNDSFGVLAVNGAYTFGSGISAFGMLGGYVVGAQELTTASIGLGYEFSPGAKAEVSLGRITDGRNHIDSVGFGLQYETGRKTTPRRSLSNILNQANGTFFGINNF